MKLLYCIRDVKSKFFSPIMTYAHDAVAIREFALQASDAQSMLARFPDDYELLQVGSFEEDQPEPLLGLDHPRFVISARTALSLIPKEQAS